MPNLLNGLVNGWVKVNSKHVIFPRDDGRRDRKDSDAGASLDESSSSRSRALDRSWGKSNRTKQSTTTTVSSQSSMDPEALAIKKFNSKRQNKRGLQRTVSHSDLLREMANERGADRSRDTPSNSRTNSHDSNRSRQHQEHDETALHVAGFFGSEERRERDQGHRRTETTFIAERSCNDWKVFERGPVCLAGETFHEWSEQWFIKCGRIISCLRSVSGYKSKSIDSSAQDQEHRHSRRETNSRGTGIMRDSLASSLQYQMKDEQRRRKHPSSSNGDSNHHHGAHSPCSGCNDMESQLLAAYDDIRYLRDVSLRSEFSKSPPRPTNRLLQGSTREPSKRLTEITGRHRRQIEQMTRETVSVTGDVVACVPWQDNPILTL